MQYMTETTKAAPKAASKNTKNEDTGSAAAQITAFTKQINELSEHMSDNKKDFMARRGLLSMVGKRKKLLKYLAREDSKQYLELIKKLGLRR